MTKDSSVFFGIVQGSAAQRTGRRQRNLTINSSNIKTAAIVQSDIIMLAGLIYDGTTHGSNEFPASAAFR